MISKLPDIDLRTQHILTYFSCNNLPRELRIIALYDLFRIQIFSENSIKLKLIQILAQIKFNDYVLTSASNNADGSDLYKVYEKWQNDYRDYRSIIAAFINAANFMESQRFYLLLFFFIIFKVITTKYFTINY